MCEISRFFIKPTFNLESRRYIIINDTMYNFRASGFRPTGFRPTVFRPSDFRPRGFRPRGFRPSVFRPSGFFVLPSFVTASCYITKIFFSDAHWPVKLCEFVWQTNNAFSENILTQSLSDTLPTLPLHF